MTHILNSSVISSKRITVPGHENDQVHPVYTDHGLYGVSAVFFTWLVEQLLELTSDLETIILNIFSSSAFAISFAKYRGGVSITNTAMVKPF